MSFSRFLVLWGVLCFFGTSLFAASEFEGRLVSKIQFDGRPYLAGMRTKEGELLSQKDVEYDIQAMYVTGEYASVSYSLAKDDADSAQVIVRIHAVDNPLISAVRVSGNRMLSQQRLLRAMRSRPGSRLNFKRVLEDQAKIESLYWDEGYEFFRVVQMDVATGNVLEVGVSEGVIGGMSIQGLQKIQPFVIQREVSQKPGAAFNRKALEGDRVRLLKMGYFGDVRTFYETGVSGTTLNYVVSEKKSNNLALGLEQDRDNVVGFLKTDLNHVFIHTDLVSVKTQLNLNRLSVRSYSLRYFQPWMLNRYHLSAAADGWSEDRSDPLTRQSTGIKEYTLNNRVGGAATLIWPIRTDRLQLSSRFKTERVLPIQSGDFNGYKINSLTWGLSFQNMVDWQHPRNGHYWQLDYERSGSILGFSTSGARFNRLNANGAFFWSPGSRQVVGIHGFAGLVNQDSQTFDGENYTLGGSGSLRGYAEGSFFGSRRVLGNVEYRYDLSDRFQLVGFYDVGATFDLSTSIALKQGRGLGVRYFTAVGPVRLDFAWGKEFFIHFNLGQVF